MVGGLQKKDILVSSLDLDQGNYRVGHQPSPQETLRAIIDEQGTKLVRLAEDMLNNGASPIELLMVAPTLGEADRFTVVEGNRRVAALKLIQDPELADGTSVYTAFQRLSKRKAEAPTSLQCVVFPDKQSGFIWAQRKHDTGLKGAGTEPWSAIAKVRADADQGKSAPAHDVLEFVLANAPLDEDVRDRVSGHDFPVTNLDRLLQSAQVRSELQLDVSGPHLKSTAERKWMLKILSDVVTAIAREQFSGRKFTVADIYTAEKQTAFIRKVASQYPRPKGPTAEWMLEATTDLESAADSANKQKTAARPHPKTTARPKLVPAGCPIKPPTGRANDIYLELRRLKVEDTRNAVAIMFRVFLEFSVEQYIAKQRITSVNENSKLKEKVRAAADHMEQNGKMSRQALKPVRTAINNPSSILAIETFHSYVHHPDFHPVPSELKTSWDRLQPFLEKLWLP